MERLAQPSPVKKEVIVRHLANLAIFTGFYHGRYFINGTYRPNEKHTAPAIPKRYQTS